MLDDINQNQNPVNQPNSHSPGFSFKNHHSIFPTTSGQNISSNFPDKTEGIVSNGLLLSPEWKTWIATKKIQSIPDGEIVHQLVQNGIDIRIAIEEVKAVDCNPYFQASKTLTEKVTTLESELENYKYQVKSLEVQLEFYHKLEEIKPSYGKIERRSHLSREEFLEKYYANNTPVILTDLLTNWKALSLWTPDYLKQKYGHVLINVQVNRESNPLYEVEKNKHQQQMLMRDYVDLVVQERKTNNYYMVPFNGNLYIEELHGLFEDIEMNPEYLDESQGKDKFSFWFGPAGTITPLHYDLINSFLAQVYGRKQIKLISPNQKHHLYNYGTWFSSVDLENADEEKYPRFKDVKILETILEPGEALFVPACWWHHVKALDITISFSLMNFIFPNEYMDLLR